MPAPKRPRIIDVEQDLRDKVRKQEEEIRKLKEQTKDMEKEKKELKEKMEEELRGLIEYPVCLTTPREKRPVPVCSNGHIVCHPCRDRIRQEAGEVVAKCPSCMVDLGNATSLLASRLVERVKHECENEGCDEMFNLTQLESHQEVCLFRKVLCPGSDNGKNDCKLEMPFNKVAEHVKACSSNSFIDIARADLNSCNTTWAQKMTHGHNKSATWKTKPCIAFERMFFVKHKKDLSNHFFETVMLGSKEECVRFIASITVQKPGQESTSSTHFAKHVSHPRPLDLHPWSDVGLLMTGKTLSQFSTTEREKDCFSITLSIKQL